MIEIKLITLKTGVNIIANIEYLFDKVIIKEPAQVIVHPAENGAQVGFLPYLNLAEEWSTGISIDRSNILCMNTPIVELRNQYSEVFGSGLTIARSMPGKIQTV